MNQDIRYAIFALDIFKPNSNTGRSIESMILGSEHLEKYSQEEIERELQLMKSDGFITLRNDNDSPQHDAW